MHVDAKISRSWLEASGLWAFCWALLRRCWDDDKGRGPYEAGAGDGHGCVTRGAQEFGQLANMTPITRVMICYDTYNIL